MNRWLLLSPALFLVAACGGTTLESSDAGGDASSADAAKDTSPSDGGPDTSGTYACGKLICQSGELCVHPCCGGAPPQCMPKEDGGTCPAGFVDESELQPGPGRLQAPSVHAARALLHLPSRTSAARRRPGATSSVCALTVTPKLGGHGSPTAVRVAHRDDRVRAPAARQRAGQRVRRTDHGLGGPLRGHLRAAPLRQHGGDGVRRRSEVPAAGARRRGRAPARADQRDVPHVDGDPRRGRGRGLAYAASAGRA